MHTQPGLGQKNRVPAHRQAVNSRQGLAFQGQVWTCTPSLGSQQLELHWQLSLQRENTAAAGGRSVPPRGRDPQRAAEEGPASVGEGGPQLRPEQRQASSLVRWSPRRTGAGALGRGSFRGNNHQTLGISEQRAVAAASATDSSPGPAPGPCGRQTGSRAGSRQGCGGATSSRGGETTDEFKAAPTAGHTTRRQARRAAGRWGVESTAFTAGACVLEGEPAAEVMSGWRKTAQGRGRGRETHHRRREMK